MNAIKKWRYDLHNQRDVCSRTSPKDQPDTVATTQSISLITDQQGWHHWETHDQHETKCSILSRLLTVQSLNTKLLLTGDTIFIQIHARTLAAILTCRHHGPFFSGSNICGGGMRWHGSFQSENEHQYRFGRWKWIFLKGHFYFQGIIINTNTFNEFRKWKSVR